MPVTLLELLFICIIFFHWKIFCAVTCIMPCVSTSPAVPEVWRSSLGVASLFLLTNRRSVTQPSTRVTLDFAIITFLTWAGTFEFLTASLTSPTHLPWHSFCPPSPSSLPAKHHDHPCLVYFAMSRAYRVEYRVFGISPRLDFCSVSNHNVNLYASCRLSGSLSRIFNFKRVSARPTKKKSRAICWLSLESCPR